MEFISIFDVIGPNMIGPSSSHTAGAASMALLARKIFKPSVPAFVRFTLYGSFAKTYKGHGTDKALLGGIMGFSPDDERIRDSFRIAEETGFRYEFTVDEKTETEHANTADIFMDDGNGYTFQVRGVSVGGGKIKLTKFNDIDVDFTGEYSALIVRQIDRPGVAAHITKCLAEANVNIAFMDLFREDKGETAYTVIQSDETIPEYVVNEIAQFDKIENVKLVQI
jgi:L-serine dehydratase